MEKEERIKDLDRRLRIIINDYCNTIGCKNCPLKWEESCSARELQDDLYKLEFED